ncbi:hypothetical protein BDQ17DRAFT_1436536 [Cyathus striatus]|nr:hypothetical protein BDQ17DRAFT_1436536 [Cyathus striatus]
MSFNGASNFSMNQPNFTEITVREANVIQTGVSGLQWLSQYMARGASHDSKDQYYAPKCHPDTRKTLLGDINAWIKITDKETGIMFLHGPPGARKSCIARSVCHDASSESLLGASFFFRRGTYDRNNADKLFTTIAYQLAMVNKDIRECILEEVERNPQIVHMSLEEQFQRLIFDPCCSIPKDRLLIKAIVIDGLDECEDAIMQVAILKLLAKAVRYEGFPLGIFITSRPELHIREMFDTKEIIFATQVISLDRIPGVSQDIRTVLESGFTRILNDPRFRRCLTSVPRPWPSPDAIKKFVQRSSSQFIYSATVLKFVSSPDQNPASQLEIVLGIRDSGDSTSPFADLDLLYREIISRVSHPKRAIKVLAYIIAMKQLGRKNGTGWRDMDAPNPIQKFTSDITKAVLHNQNRLLLVIDQLLDLPCGESYLALNQLHSLVSLNVASNSTRRHLEITFYHKSFQDFLSKKKRSDMFHVNVQKIHSDIAQSCLKFMGLSSYKTDQQHVGWLYACFHWYIHYGKGTRSGCHLSDFDFALRRFFSGSTQHLDASSLKAAFETLGLHGTQAIQSDVQASGNLWKYGTLSTEDLYYTALAICNTFGWKMFKQRHQEDYFMASFTFPVWVQYFQSYKNDALVKQLLVMFSFNIWEDSTIPLSYMHRLVQDAGYITSPDADRAATILLKAISFCGFIFHEHLKKLLFYSKYSGPFYCTQDEYAHTYCHMFVTCRRLCDIKCLTDFLKEWTRGLSSLHDSFNLEHPDLLKGLKSEALVFHDNGVFNQKFTLYSYTRLISWLRKVKCPRDIVELWQKAFDKAKITLNYQLVLT